VTPNLSASDATALLVLGTMFGTWCARLEWTMPRMRQALLRGTHSTMPFSQLSYIRGASEFFCLVSPTTDDAAVAATAARTFQRELASLARRINPDALIARASLSLFVEASPALFFELTPETVGSLPRGTFFVQFDDGVDWLCWIRRHSSTALHSPAQDCVVLSEGAKLLFLAE
jgi:transposase InsO family protein